LLKGQQSLQILPEETSRVSESEDKRENSQSFIDNMFKQRFSREDSTRIKKGKYEE
jgi:hypothetical protein